jgi:hypothetical protein
MAETEELGVGSVKLTILSSSRATAEGNHAVTADPAGTCPTTAAPLTDTVVGFWSLICHTPPVSALPRLPERCR